MDSENRQNVRDDDLEQTNCPLCDSCRSSTKYEFAPFVVVRCLECSLGYLSPRPTEETMMGLYRDVAYFSGKRRDRGYTDYSRQEKGLRWTFRRLMNRLERSRMTGGRLVEIGSGEGYLLDEARDFFGYRLGTEYCPEIARRASRFADRVLIGGVDAIPGQEFFECGISIGVLEHVYAPVHFLSEIGRHIVKGGHFVVVTPDFDGIWRRFFGRRWPSFKLPEHITYFNRRTLQFAAEQSGFQFVQTFSYTQAFPLSLILEKIALKIPSDLLERAMLPVPATMLGAILRKRS